MLNVISYIKGVFRARNTLKYCQQIHLDLQTPFSISNIEHIKTDCGTDDYVYIGDNAWMELRGYIYLGGGQLLGQD